MATTANADLLGREPPAGPLTFEEFLAWCDEDTRAEWVAGRVVLMSPASDPHQRVIQFLVRILTVWIESRDLGKLYLDFLMRMPDPVSSGRVPDLLFVSRAHADRARHTYLAGPADLVIEIVSPDSISRDRGEKFVEYEKAGIPEYWLLDPEREQGEFYELGADGRYRLALGGRDGTYRSRVLDGLPLELEWLWQDPPPPTLSVLRHLGLLG